MAYDYFTQPQGPTINTSLFQEAAESGIRQGKASPSFFTSAVQGLKEGVEFGQKVVANDQAAQINQNTIDQLPQRNAAQAVQDERQRLALETDRLNAEAAQKNKDSNLLASNLKAQAEVVKAQEQLDDLANAKTIADLAVSQDGAAITAALQDPKLKGTLIRNSDLALKLLGTAANAPGVDLNVLKSAQASYDAIEQQKARQKQLEQEQKLRADYAVKNEEKYRDASALIEANPALASIIEESVQNPDAYDYRKLQLYPKNGVTVADGKLALQANGLDVDVTEDPANKDKSYILAYGDKVLDTIPDIEARDYAQRLRDYKVGKQVRGAYVPTSKSAKQELAPDAAQGAPTPTPTFSSNATPAVNQNILEAAATRNKERFAKAQASGQANTYTTLQAKGRSMVQQKAPPVDPISTPQNTPIPQGTPAVTQAVPTPAPVSSTGASAGAPVAFKQINTHLSDLMGGADVQLNVGLKTSPVSYETVATVNALPAMKNRSALLKGLVSVESAGNPNAVSPAGAVGLTQLMKGAASDVGLSAEDRTNPELNVNAGEQYYSRMEKQISKAYADQGYSITPDPRVVLAAYNGGAKYIVNAISKGIVSWEDTKEYLKTVKADKKLKENLAYPDKVILASIPYIQGGNASDDAYVKSLLGFGIIELA